MKILYLLFCIFSAFIYVYANEERYEKDFDDPLRRFLEFNKPRAYPFESIPDFARQKAIEQTEEILAKTIRPEMLKEQPEWRPIGPFDIGGRIKSIVFHPLNQNVAYAAAAAGGIWLTSNLGQSWNPIFDFENGIAFGALAIDVNSPNVIWAGTGESVLGGGMIYLGNGIYKSTDAGRTWKLMGLTEVGAFSRIYVHPLNSNLIVAGATIRRPGLYLSTDAGNSWQRVFAGNVTDLSINPKDENEIIIGVNADGIYYTSDKGKTWSRRVNGIETGFGRISVQFAPSAPDIAYTLLDISSQGYIYRTTNKGQTWTLVYKGDQSFFNNQGFYNNFIEVHPQNPNIVLAGGIDLWRTGDGKNWTNVSNSGSNRIHVDQHCAAFFPKNPNLVLLGNDGGVYFSSDAGYSWVPKNSNLQVTQFYGFDIDNTKPNVNFGGTQDNGTLGNQSEVWGFIAGGDGFRTVVDYLNPDIVYGQTTPGGRISPFKLNLRTGDFAYLNNGINLNENVWDPPLIIDPNFNNILYNGRVRLYVSYNFGANWEVLRTPPSSGRFTAVDVSSLNSEYIVAGTSVGDVFLSTNAGESWEVLSNNGLVNRWVTDIAFSPFRLNTIYVTFSGFFTPHIFKSTDLGKTWLNISRTFPDIPVNTIAIHPLNEDILFVGTDIGVFVSYDGGNNWFPYGKKLPRSPVTELKFLKYKLSQETTRLRAATHGRGIWEVEVPLEIITEPEIASPAGGEIFTSTTMQTISWYGFTPPVRIEFSSDDGTTWQTIAENVVSSPFLWAVPNRASELARIRISSQSLTTQSKVSNSFTIVLVEKGSILQATGINQIPYGIAFDGKNGLWVTSFQTNQLVRLNANTFVREKSLTLPGDSLFTDIAYDRNRHIIYVHRMNSTSGGGGNVIVLDTNGKVLREFQSPANVYPIGLEVFDDKLLIGDRDKKDAFNRQMLFVASPIDGTVEATFTNPYSKNYGPRGLAYDREKYVYQVGTFFPSGASLSEAVVSKIDKNNLSVELERIPLQTMTGLINARGVEYDPRDKNLWITDYNGNIYKIAGFELVLSADKSIKNELRLETSVELSLYPNPASDIAFCSIKSNKTILNASIEIVDLFGSTVLKMQLAPLEKNIRKYFELDLSNLYTGTYFVKIFTSDGLLESKLIIVLK
ncbi:MAG: YCF48-related protein [Ignavibacteria bacterium]|nr:YCF48-related protein [Ignavibacteria bacterium]